MQDKKKRELIARVWEGLDKSWVEDHNYIAKRGRKVYRLTCSLFNVYLSEVDVFIWRMELVTGPGDLTPYSKTFNIDGHSPSVVQDAQRQAMHEIFEVLTGGLAAFGIIWNQEKPVDELRIKHAFVERGKDPYSANMETRTMYGVGEDGILYVYDPGKEEWSPISMKKSLK